MKITKTQLREMVREELHKINEVKSVKFPISGGISPVSWLEFKHK